jgi:hypothetical protein
MGTVPFTLNSNLRCQEGWRAVALNSNLHCQEGWQAVPTLNVR